MIFNRFVLFELPMENQNFITPLNSAAANGNPHMVSDLLESGEDPFFEAPGQLCATSEYALFGRLDLIREIHKIYPKINLYSEAMILAAASGELQILNYFLEIGVSPNSCLKDCHSLIMLENFLIIKSKTSNYLYRTMKLTKENLTGNSALFWALAFSKKECAKSLINKGASIEAFENPQLKTSPLIIGTLTANYASAKLLLEKGADKNFKDFSGRTALDYLEEFGRYPEHRLILRVLRKNS